MPRKKAGAGASSSEETPKSSNSNTDSARQPLREIVYLDVPRVTSYLSQLQGGLTEFAEFMKSKTQNDMPGEATFQLGGAFPIGFSSSSGRVENVDASAELERKTAHHAVLTVLERILTEQKLLSEVGHSSPFVKYVDYPMLTDYKYLSDKLGSMADLQEAFAKTTAFNTALGGVDPNSLSRKDRQTRFATAKGTVKNVREELDQTQLMYDGYSRVFRESEEKIAVYLPSLGVAGTLDPRHMLTPTALLIDNYGMPTRLLATILALQTNGKTDHEPLTAPDDREDVQGGGGLGYAAAYLTEHYVRATSALGHQDASPILPIAIYFELGG